MCVDNPLLVTLTKCLQRKWCGTSYTIKFNGLKDLIQTCPDKTGVFSYDVMT